MDHHNLTSSRNTCKTKQIPWHVQKRCMVNLSKSSFNQTLAKEVYKGKVLSLMRNNKFLASALQKSRLEIAEREIHAVKAGKHLEVINASRLKMKHMSDIVLNLSSYLDEAFKELTDYISAPTQQKKDRFCQKDLKTKIQNLCIEPIEEQSEESPDKVKNINNRKLNKCSRKRKTTENARGSSLSKKRLSTMQSVEATVSSAPHSNAGNNSSGTVKAADPEKVKKKRKSKKSACLDKNSDSNSTSTSNKVAGTVTNSIQELLDEVSCAFLGDIPTYSGSSVTKAKLGGNSTNSCQDIKDNQLVSVDIYADDESLSEELFMTTAPISLLDTDVPSEDKPLPPEDITSVQNDLNCPLKSIDNNSVQEKSTDMCSEFDDLGPLLFRETSTKEINKNISAFNFSKDKPTIIEKSRKQSFKNKVGCEKRKTASANISKDTKSSKPISATGRTIRGTEKETSETKRISIVHDKLNDSSPNSSYIDCIGTSVSPDDIDNLETAVKNSIKSLQNEPIEKELISPSLSSNKLHNNKNKVRLYYESEDIEVMKPKCKVNKKALKEQNKHAQNFVGPASAKNPCYKLSANTYVVAAEIHQLPEICPLSNSNKSSGLGQPSVVLRDILKPCKVALKECNSVDNAKENTENGTADKVAVEKLALSANEIDDLDTVFFEKQLSISDIRTMHCFQPFVVLTDCRNELHKYNYFPALPVERDFEEYTDEAGRKRRRTIIKSYKEPCLNTKLRRM